jgi:hypothetical protein
MWLERRKSYSLFPKEIKVGKFTKNKKVGEGNFLKCLSIPIEREVEKIYE